MRKIDYIPENMVLITETCGVKVQPNEGRWGEQEPGFSIRQPQAGLIDKEYWNFINRFQNINLECDNEIIDKMIKISQVVTREDLLKYTDLQKWDDLIRESKSFCNTINEFNILTGIDRDGQNQLRRTICELGKKNWKQIDII